VSGLQVVYIGNFEPSHSTENHVRASLEELGVTVRPVQENRTTWRALDPLVAEADLLLYTRTWGLPDPDQGLRWLARCPIPTVSYHLDLYAGLPRGRALRQDPFRCTQHVFTPDGGSADFFREQGVAHHYLKPGVYGRECVLLGPAPHLTADVGFVGSELYHPEWPYRGRLLQFLRDTWGPRFAKHGPPQPTVRGETLNRVYASVKVVVGDSLCLDFDHPHYWSDRIYETLGRGGFLVHPYVFGLEEEFTDRQHVVFYRYGDLAMLRDLVEHYLHHPEEREAIRRAGHAHVKASCTYVHRMRELLGVVGQAHPELGAWT